MLSSNLQWHLRQLSTPLLQQDPAKPGYQGLSPRLGLQLLPVLARWHHQRRTPGSHHMPVIHQLVLLFSTV